MFYYWLTQGYSWNPHEESPPSHFCTSLSRELNSFVHINLCRKIEVRRVSFTSYSVLVLTFWEYPGLKQGRGAYRGGRRVESNEPIPGAREDHAFMRSRVHEGLPFVCSGLPGLAQRRNIVGRQWRKNAELDLVPAVREKICGSGLNTDEIVFCNSR